jgi:mRNA interferase MazF
LEPLAAGTIALVLFPFSDLSQSKYRPVLVLAPAGRGDFILCQITSNRYADPLAIELTDQDFAEGSLRRASYVRPGKLFTAHGGLVRRRVGALRVEAYARAVDRVVALIRGGSPPGGQRRR